MAAWHSYPHSSWPRFWRFRTRIEAAEREKRAEIPADILDKASVASGSLQKPENHGRTGDFLICIECFWAECFESLSW